MIGLVALVMLSAAQLSYEEPAQECQTDADCMLVIGACGMPTAYNVTNGKQMQDYYKNAKPQTGCDEHKSENYSVHCLDKQCKLQEKR